MRFAHIDAICAPPTGTGRQMQQHGPIAQ